MKHTIQFSFLSSRIAFWSLTCLTLILNEMSEIDWPVVKLCSQSAPFLSLFWRTAMQASIYCNGQRIYRLNLFCHPCFMISSCVTMCVLWAYILFCFHILISWTNLSNLSWNFDSTLGFSFTITAVKYSLANFIIYRRWEIPPSIIHCFYSTFAVQIYTCISF